MTGDHRGERIILVIEPRRLRDYPYDFYLRWIWWPLFRIKHTKTGCNKDSWSGGWWVWLTRGVWE